MAYAKRLLEDGSVRLLETGDVRLTEEETAALLPVVGGVSLSAPGASVSASGSTLALGAVALSAPRAELAGIGTPVAVASLGLLAPLGAFSGAGGPYGHAPSVGAVAMVARVAFLVRGSIPMAERGASKVAKPPDETTSVLISNSRTRATKG